MEIPNSIKGTGRRLENETVICFNEAEPEAIVSTASPKDYRLLLRRGYLPAERWNLNRARFRIPKRAVSIRRAKQQREKPPDAPDLR